MMCALSVVVLALGAVFEALDLTAAALASICIAFIYIEVGAPYTFIAWICTTVLSFLFFPQSLLWIEYLLLFGLYPILKGYIERSTRHPVAMICLHFPFFLSQARSKMLSIDSCFALSIKPQVLITMISASVSSGVIS